MIVEIEVPEGPVLNPILFLVYKNIIVKIHLCRYLYVFADDTDLIFTDRD